MTYQAFSFSGGQNGTDPNAQANMQQYLQQAQMQGTPPISPDASSSPMQGLNGLDLAKKLSSLLIPQNTTSEQAPLMANPAYLGMSPAEITHAQNIANFLGGGNNG